VSDSTSASVRGTADKASEAVKDAASSATDAVKDAGSAAADTAKKAEKSVEKTADKAADKSAAGVEKAATTVEKKAEAVEKKAAAAGSAAKDAATDAKAGAKSAAADATAAATGEKPKPPQRSVAEIQTELDATRDRLAGRIDDLQEYVAPKNVANRQLAKVKGVFVDEFGGIKPDRVLIAAGVVVGLVVVVGISRRSS
jgi:hypothetical protein